MSRAAALLLMGCGPRLDGDAPDILLVILDDIGVDQLASYDVPHAERPETPVLDGLGETSVRFTNAYAMPVCSTTRYAALTGRYGRRVGLGKALQRDDVFEVARDEITLAEEVGRLGYETAAIGKWHLASNTPNAAVNPAVAGFALHDGTLNNTPYFGWSRVVNGERRDEAGYTTRVFTDAALDARSDTPWFHWVAYNAAHAVTPAPPDDLNPRGVRDDDPEVERYRATVEALDSELGRLLADTDDAIVVVLGDNGTHVDWLSGDWSPHAGKGSVWEGGVRVPLWVRVPGGDVGTHEGLVHAVDLLPTLVELVGQEARGEIDGLSFAGALFGGDVERDHVYVERFLEGTDHTAVRDARYKRVERDGVVSYHDLQGRSDDGPAIEPPQTVRIQLDAFVGLHTSP